MPDFIECFLIDISNYEVEIQTLEELSLKIIIENFSKYSIFYQSIENEYHKNLFYFLQTMFTKRIFRYLIANKELKEEHLDVLINEELKELNISEILQCVTKPDFLINLLSICHSLTKLSGICGFTEILNRFSPLPDCETSGFCDDDALKLIASSCSQLTDLDISFSCVTGVGLQAFYIHSNNSTQTKCPLKRINLHATKIKDDDLIEFLKNVPTLEEVEVTLPELSVLLSSVCQKDTLETMKLKFHKRTSLSLSSIRSTDNLIKIFAEICPNTKRLSVVGFEAEEIESCSLFTKLEYVEIINNKYDANIELYYKKGLNYFLTHGGRNLKHLEVKKFELSISSLIDSCPHLETLILNLVRYQSFDNNIVKSLKHLQNLKLIGVNFSTDFCTDSVMKLLMSSPNLKNLTFERCKFDVIGIVTQLSVYSLDCRVELLRFAHSNVTFEIVQNFVQNCNSPRKIYLTGCKNLSSADISKIVDTIEPIL